MINYIYIKYGVTSWQKTENIHPEIKTSTKMLTFTVALQHYSGHSS